MHSQRLEMKGAAMSEEIWKPILDYENYVVSNRGNVKNIKRNKLLSPGLNKDGYKLLFCTRIINH